MSQNSTLDEAFLVKHQASYVSSQIQCIDNVIEQSSARIPRFVDAVNADDSTTLSIHLASLLKYIKDCNSNGRIKRATYSMELYCMVLRQVLDSYLGIPVLSRMLDELQTNLMNIIHFNPEEKPRRRQRSNPPAISAPPNSQLPSSLRSESKPGNPDDASRGMQSKVSTPITSKNKSCVISPRAKKIVELSENEQDVVQIALYIKRVIDYLETDEVPEPTSTEEQKKAVWKMRKSIANNSFFKEISMNVMEARQKYSRKKLNHVSSLQLFHIFVVSTQELLRRTSTFCTEIAIIGTDLWNHFLHMANSGIDSKIRIREQKEEQIKLLRAEKANIEAELASMQAVIRDQLKQDVQLLATLQALDEQSKVLTDEMQWQIISEKFMSFYVAALRQNSEKTVWFNPADDIAEELGPGSRLLQDDMLHMIIYVIHLMILSRSYVHVNLSEDITERSMDAITRAVSRTPVHTNWANRSSTYGDNNSECSNDSSDDSYENYGRTESCDRLHDISPLEMKVLMTANNLLRCGEEICAGLTVRRRKQVVSVGVDVLDPNNMTQNSKAGDSPTNKSKDVMGPLIKIKGRVAAQLEVVRERITESANDNGENQTSSGVEDTAECEQREALSLSLEDISLPAHLTEMLGLVPKDSKHEVMLDSLLLETIESIYNAKVEANDLSLERGDQKEVLYEFLLSYYLEQYSYPILAETKLAELIISIAFYTDDTFEVLYDIGNYSAKDCAKMKGWIRLIADFIHLYENSKLPSPAIELFLFCREKFFQSAIGALKTNGTSTPSKKHWTLMDGQTEWTLLETAMKCVLGSFQNSDKRLVEQTCQTLQYNSVSLNFVNKAGLKKSRGIMIQTALMVIVNAWRDEYKVNEYTVAMLVNAADLNKDGTISFDEFEDTIVTADPRLRDLQLAKAYSKSIESSHFSASNCVGHLDIGTVVRTIQENSLLTVDPSLEKEISFASKESKSKLRRNPSIFGGKSPTDLEALIPSFGLDRRLNSKSVQVLKDTWNASRHGIHAKIHSLGDGSMIGSVSHLCNIRYDRLEELLKDENCDPVAAWQAYRLLLMEVSRSKQVAEKNNEIKILQLEETMREEQLRRSPADRRSSTRSRKNSPSRGQRPATHLLGALKEQRKPSKLIQAYQVMRAVNIKKNL